MFPFESNDIVYCIDNTELPKFMHSLTLNAKYIVRSIYQYNKTLFGVYLMGIYNDKITSSLEASYKHTRFKKYRGNIPQKQDIIKILEEVY